LLNFGFSEKYRHLYPVTAAILALFSMFILVWSQFYPYLMEKFGLISVAPVALSSSIVFASTLVFQIAAGFMADRLGPKLPLALAGIGILAGMTVISLTFSHDSWENARLYWYAGSLVIGVGSGFYVGTFPVVLGRWFPESPGRAFGIAIFGQNLSPLVMSPLVAYLVANIGLSDTFVILGVVVSALIYLIGFAFWKVPPAHWHPSRSAASEAKHISLKQAVRDRRFWTLFTVMYSTAFGWFLIILNIATIIVEGLVEAAGMRADYVVGAFVPMFMALTAIGNAVGGFFWGIVNDRIGGPLRTLPLVYFVGGVAIVLLILSYTNPVTLLAVGILLYFALGGEPTVHFSAVPTFFGREAVGRITTILNTSVFTSAIVGPYVGAFLKDATGTYFSSLVTAALLHFFAVAVVLVGRKYAGGEASVQVRKPEGA